MEALRRDFFDRPTLVVARQLLGHRLVRREAGGDRSSGLVIEVEAYIGSEDQACHCRHGKTPRNAVMWGAPGHAYVYFTYGMHWMLNVVTEREGYPAAILLRAMLPLEGVEIMRERRGGRPDRELANGPAKLCQALQIDATLNGHDLVDRSSHLYFESAIPIPDGIVRRGPRVGLNRVPEPWLSKPWRFYASAEDVLALMEEEIPG